jgi:hypothetical protein
MKRADDRRPSADSYYDVNPALVAHQGKPGRVGYGSVA